MVMEMVIGKYCTVITNERLQLRRALPILL